MALSVSDLKAHCNVTSNADDALLTRLLAAATARIESSLGFKLGEEFPPTSDEPPKSTVPADLELGVLMLAAHWYENREASLVNVTAQILPLGVTEIIADHRRYTFGLGDEAAANG